MYGLNNPIKRQRLSDCIKKKTLWIKRYRQIENKRMKKIYHGKSNHKLYWYKTKQTLKQINKKMLLEIKNDIL